ncbi:hypothetical protein DFH08DRAFT_810294 [Mycena albidolilacea]|uniref:Uncharacterized protein n=1 Tax=Mycena albidolilacea TaxID=1033008 RepID=A0AAD6ZXS5_9AGAR|nr:hypothetical protein DFH08DRAFT_810294 [Mycena albidolilacea]
MASQGGRRTTGPTARGTHELLSVYRVSPGWGSRRVTRCLADPEAVAECRYREKNLEKTREKACQRMQLLRKRKFVAKFGEDAFFDFYLPQHNLRGAEHLPGIAV